MAKGAKKKGPGDFSPTRPNKWVKVASSNGRATCTECGRPMMRGMRWIDGAVSACQRCGEALSRRAA